MDQRNERLKCAAKKWMGDVDMTKEDRKNAYLYCKFRDEQFAFYDEYA